MKKNAVVYAVCTASLLGAFAVNASASQFLSIEDGRCGTWGDSLEQTEAKPRVDFSNRCSAEREATLQAAYDAKKCDAQNDPLVSECEVLKERIGKQVSIRADNDLALSLGLTRRTSNEATKGYPTYGKVLVASKPGELSSYTNLIKKKAPDGSITEIKWFAPPQKDFKDLGCKDIPPGFDVAFYCASGCYAPDQLLLTPQGYVDAQSAYLQNLKQMVALSSDSTADRLRFRNATVMKYITDIVPGEQELLTFETLDGGSLKVTPNHPLVTGDGYMRTAADMKVGDFLVKADGTRDPILKIRSSKEFTKVYNLDVESADPSEKVLVAQGYLNGSVYFQNAGIKEINRRILRLRASEVLE